MIVVPFLSIYITQELGWSKWQAGVLTSCYGIGSLLGSFIGGNLIDRFGSYRVMFNSLWMGGVLFMSLMFFKDFYGLCGMLFLTSTIADIFRPAAFNSIGLYAKPENYTRSNGRPYGTNSDDAVSFCPDPSMYQIILTRRPYGYQKSDQSRLAFGAQAGRAGLVVSVKFIFGQCGQ